MPAAYNLGDLAPRRVRWLVHPPLTSWSERQNYEARCSSCPGCGRNFIAGTRATTAIGIPGSHQWKQRSHCNDCLPEYLRRQKNLRQQRYRDRHQVERHAICQHCGQQFPIQRSTARFCSTRCRVEAHRCQAASESLASIPGMRDSILGGMSAPFGGLSSEPGW